MGMLDIRRPDLSRGSNIDQKLQLVLDAVEQMSKQFQHALNHLGEESLSDELKEVLNKLKADQAIAQNAVSKQLLTSVQKELEKKITSKADAKAEKDGKATDLWTLVLALCSGDEAAGSLDNSAVLANGKGIQLKSGCTLTTATGKFAIAGDGGMTAQDASFTGSLTKDGQNILTSRDIVVATSTPSNPTAGMIWIEPTTSNAGWNTCTVHYYKG